MRVSCSVVSMRIPEGKDVQHSVGDDHEPLDYNRLNLEALLELVQCHHSLFSISMYHPRTPGREADDSSLFDDRR